MDPNAMAAAMQVPSYGQDQRIRDAIPGQKRNIQSAQDIADSMLTSISGKRFRGDGIVGAMRNALPDQLARGLNVVNTGFSTTDAQTDEIISQSIFSRPYSQHWEQGFVENTALFCNRKEPMFGIKNIYTLADVPTLNFMLELGHLGTKQQAFAPQGAVMSDLGNLRKRFEHLVADTSEEFADTWNFLGPLVTSKESGVYSSFEPSRRVQGGERILSFSIYNRAHTFNLFSPTLRRGQQLYFICKDQDLSGHPSLLDPRGHAVVARTGGDGYSPQVVGFSDKDAPFPFHNTEYRPDQFTNPREGDLDYIRRDHAVKQEYVDYEVNEDGTVKVRDTGADDPESIPQIVYDAYMIGNVKRVGLARATSGRSPSQSQIVAAHRSQERMKLLQTVEIYRGL